MKAFVLQKIAQKLQTYTTIHKAFRVEENLLYIKFNSDNYYFDMTKGQSNIYINISVDVTKKFTAPFDGKLEKLLTKATLLGVKAFERILELTLSSLHSFKRDVYVVRFEFTGRYTNIIILDEKREVIEALHYVSHEQSVRSVIKGELLKEIPPREIKEKVEEIADIEAFTQKLFHEKEGQKVDQIKKTLFTKVDKKIQTLDQKLLGLESEESLKKEANRCKYYADTIMANLYLIKPYEKEVSLKDFEGREVLIPLPSIANKNELGNHFYKHYKKFLKKSEGVSKERHTLEEKKNYLLNLKQGISSSSNINDINIFKQTKKERHKEENIELFFIDDFKVLVGKNEKGNIEILKKSKANDLWFHIKDLPGSHVTLITNKTNVPEEVLQKCAKLAIIFSNKNEGIVDYTKRKFVKIQEKANVVYANYHTLKVKL